MGKGKRRDQYDYESAFGNRLGELDGIFIEEMMKDRVGLHYATKTIKSGKVLEVEIYPWFNRKADIPHIQYERPDNRKAQNSLNSKKSRRRLIRLVNANFGEGDYWITLTYRDDCYPESEEAAKRHLTNYIKRVNRRRKRAGLENARYIYIMEWEEGPEGTRCHFHLLMEGGIDRNELEDMWKFSVVNDTSRIHPDGDGITGLAEYLAKKQRRKKGQRHWNSSKGLKQPEESVSHSKTRKKQVEKMVRDYEEIRAYFEKDRAWKQYEFVDAEVMYNKFNCAFYIRIRARERSWEQNGRKRKEGGTDNGIRPVHRRTVCGSDEGGERGRGSAHGGKGGKNAGNTPCDGGTGSGSGAGGKSR